jgi:hypothetical protein
MSGNRHRVWIWLSHISKSIFSYGASESCSVVLRSNRKGKLNIYSTHYLDASHPVHDQSEVDEAGHLFIALRQLQHSEQRIAGHER